MKRSTVIDRNRLLAAERRRIEAPAHGRIRVGVGYPSSYHVAQSSLAFQWIHELTARQPEVGVERFYADSDNRGATLETEAQLARLDVLAWSCSFELDAVNLLSTLGAARIPLTSADRGDGWPLVVVGGPLASINPLPLAPAVDVFVLGAGEILWSPLLQLVVTEPTRERLLDELASRAGYFVPSRQLDPAGRPATRLRRLEKRSRDMVEPGLVPCSSIVTPHTEYARCGLVEISRGCPERCRYCWVSHSSGRLRCYPGSAILDRVDQLRPITDRIGLVATAVGDHPELVSILDGCRQRRVDVAVSSLRIPAMVPQVLEALAASGSRSVTIAPETGSDRLRRLLNKPISNDSIFEAVDSAQVCGIHSLKMYFIIGLPGESDCDLEGIGSLVRGVREILVGRGRERGRVGTLHVGVSGLVPKPYTPFHNQPMMTAVEAKRRIHILRRSLSGLANTRLALPSWRETLWQGFLSRAGIDAYPLLEAAASGTRLARLLADNRELVAAFTTVPPQGHSPWHIISSAPHDAAGAS